MTKKLLYTNRNGSKLYDEGINPRNRNRIYAVYNSQGKLINKSDATRVIEDYARTHGVEIARTPRLQKYLNKHRSGSESFYEGLLH